MTEKEKLELLEETFETDEGSLNPDMKLEEIEEYDSMTKLSLIVMFDDEFGKKISGDQIKSFVYVKYILELMEK